MNLVNRVRGSTHLFAFRDGEKVVEDRQGRSYQRRPAHSAIRGAVADEETVLARDATLHLMKHNMVFNEGANSIAVDRFLFEMEPARRTASRLADGAGPTGRELS